MTFLTANIMAGEDWRGLEVAVGRLMGHCGWKNVQDIAQSGDKGADILANRYNPNRGTNESYLVQVKAVSGGNYVGNSAIKQAIEAQDYYRSDIVVIATNGDFYPATVKRAAELRNIGIDVRLWNGAFLSSLWEKMADNHAHEKTPYKYQEDIILKLLEDVKNLKGRSLFVVATGLGKTVIASTATQLLLASNFEKVLVLCHSTDLAYQLEREFWTQLKKTVRTRVFLDGQPPVPIPGVNFGLYQTFQAYMGAIEPDAFDLVIVDEAHHALANAFALCINYLRPKHLIGMTATPWRGDGGNIEHIFGPPVEKVSLVDGMSMGYLASVDYRLMCDNIDWDEVERLSAGGFTIRDLNKRLFVPQRDDAIIDQVITAAKGVSAPKIAVFSPSVEHAESFARKLTRRGIPSANASIPNKVERRRRLGDFTSGRLQCLTSVDVLNEGIDVPDVNLIVFLRATHSRRIFVQQLGRGLRLAPGKNKVLVLDFVTDIRRMAAVVGMEREAQALRTSMPAENMWLDGKIVEFSDESARKFVEAWINDVADLEDAADSEKLAFPE